MGEISEGLIDGTFDSMTGEYLGEGPGYPRTRQKNISERSKGSRAKIGLHKMMRMKYGLSDHKEANELIREFGGTMLLNRNLTLKQYCRTIQDEYYDMFIKWLKVKK